MSSYSYRELNNDLIFDHFFLSLKLYSPCFLSNSTGIKYSAATCLSLGIRILSLNKLWPFWSLIFSVSFVTGDGRVTQIRPMSQWAGTEMLFWETSSFPDRSWLIYTINAISPFSCLKHECPRCLEWVKGQTHRTRQRAFQKCQLWQLQTTELKQEASCFWNSF